MWLFQRLCRLLALGYLTGVRALLEHNDITDIPPAHASQAATPEAPSVTPTPSLENVPKYEHEVDPDGSFHQTLKDNATKPTPIDRLDEMSKDITREIANNPYFKIPQYDRKIRELAILHPAVMEQLGVYVIPLKKSTEKTEDQSSDTKATDGGETLDINAKATEKANSDTAVRSNLSYILEQSEMIKAMTPEQKLQFIPRLKDTIVYEIMKNVRTIEELSAKVAENEVFDTH
ncbi:methyl-accepting chemotaxis factor, putative [Babesia ovis]|uniref:Methyl-accepting chemotaxis factor, putative n=1 Tax=Babesia ovis TaxID=5869 RepID=A0A9W5T9H2_BABOV|nr:methyl-accepting chemotaxis factor, putative [Babesia ovis]